MFTIFTRSSGRSMKHKLKIQFNAIIEKNCKREIIF